MLVRVKSLQPLTLTSNLFVPNNQLFRISFTSPVQDKPISKKKQTKIIMMNTNTMKNKPRILCLHGFRTSGSILKKQVERLPQDVLGKLDLVFLDAPFPARGKSDVEGFFDPPYYEWYQSSQDFREYRNFEECITYIEDYMIKNGPFDGLLGFSQGAMISAALPGMQVQGTALTKVPKIKFVIIISGAKFIGYKYGQPKLAVTAFSSPIQCPSLHIIGEMDFLKGGGTALLESFVEPVVIHHSKGHVVPRLDEKGLQTMIGFIERIQALCNMPKNDSNF